MQTLTVPGVVRGASAPAVGERVMTRSCLYEGRGPLRVDVAGREWEPQGLPRHTCSEAPTDHTPLEQAPSRRARHDPNGTGAPVRRSSGGECASKQKAPPPTVAFGFGGVRAAWRAGEHHSSRYCKEADPIAASRAGRRAAGHGSGSAELARAGRDLG